MSLLVFFLALLLVDIFMVGYLINDKVGAYIYNAGHTMILPLAIGLMGYYVSSRLLVSASLIWLAHIGVDRAFGYGLKLESGFKDTHLGRIGEK